MLYSRSLLVIHVPYSSVLVAQSSLTLCDSMEHQTRLFCPWNSPGKNRGVGSHFLLQGILPTQGLNPGLPHCRQMLYHLCHQGSLTSKCDVKCDVSQTDFPTCHSTSIPDPFTLFSILANCNFILHFSQKPESYP